jgi:hypothetical protein
VREIYDLRRSKKQLAAFDTETRKAAPNGSIPYFVEKIKCFSNKYPIIFCVLEKFT